MAYGSGLVSRTATSGKAVPTPDPEWGLWSLLVILAITCFALAVALLTMVCRFSALLATNVVAEAEAGTTAEAGTNAEAAGKDTKAVLYLSPYGTMLHSCRRCSHIKYSTRVKMLSVRPACAGHVIDAASKQE